jgi:hypothetical protein
MTSMNWKTWTAAALIIVALFAIYVFAAPHARENAGPAAASGPHAAIQHVSTPGVEPVHIDLLEAESGSYKSDRNLFSYVEPPPPPPPAPPKPPPPPPDTDKDGVPDFRDNCASTANPDQQDIDHDGIGTACETEQEIVPPPPPPVPPQFTYKFIGMFGPAASPIATFTRDDEIVNAKAGEILDGKFVLRSIGIESIEIGFVGFPPDVRQRIPLGQ